MGTFPYKIPGEFDYRFAAEIVKKRGDFAKCLQTS